VVESIDTGLADVIQRYLAIIEASAHRIESGTA
jgi:hypothetical protein